MKRTTVNKLVLTVAVPLMLVGCVAHVDPVPTTAAVTTTQYGSAVVVERRPPALRVETHTASPGDRYVWVRGYWRWTGADYDCCQADGSFAQGPRRRGSKVGGNGDAAAGLGTTATGDNRLNDEPSLTPTARRLALCGSATQLCGCRPYLRAQQACSGSRTKHRSAAIA